jgi:hypothetical protein
MLRGANQRNGRIEQDQVEASPHLVEQVSDHSLKPGRDPVSLGVSASALDRCRAHVDRDHLARGRGCDDAVDTAACAHIQHPILLAHLLPHDLGQPQRIGRIDIRRYDKGAAVRGDRDLPLAYAAGERSLVPAAQQLHPLVRHHRPVLAVPAHCGRPIHSLTAAAHSSGRSRWGL